MRILEIAELGAVSGGFDYKTQPTQYILDGFVWGSVYGLGILVVFGVAEVGLVLPICSAIHGGLNTAIVAAYHIDNYLFPEN